MQKLVLLLIWLGAYTIAHASANPDTGTAELKKLYAVLVDKLPNKTAMDERWPHRTILYKVLDIDRSTMTDSVIAIKMQLGWQQLANMRISEDSEPELYFNDLLLASLQHGYGALLLDAVRWGVDLNYMNHTERKTLIDYLEDEYRNNTSTTHAEWLREYKQVLLAGGARYFHELNFYMRKLADKYNKVRPPLYQLFPVQRNEKWGWVDKDNKVIIPIRYKAIRKFTDKFFEVSDDGKRFYFIDRKARKQTGN